MIELNDTKSNADEAAQKAREDGDERAAARPGEAFASNGADDAPDAHAPAASSVPAAAEGADRDSRHEPHIDPHVEPLVLQPGFQAGDKSQYHVAELLSYHDRHFVESVYQAILGRAPFPAEGERELDELRGGRASKVEIIERLLSSPEARASGRDVRIEGLPSPAMRRLVRVPVVGYVLRLARALVRLPLLMQHQQQFEIYALARQQLIADYLNQTLPQLARPLAAAGGSDAPAPPILAPSQHEEIAETLAMFSDALLELSNSHAELQAQTQTQVEQAQSALAELTEAVTAQQQLAEVFRREQQLAADALRRDQQLASDTLRREQQSAADAQREFLIQEQRVIVETQRVVLEELREELRALSERQQRARDEFDAEARRLRSLQEAAARGNFSGQT